MDVQTVCFITPPSGFLKDQRVMPFLGPLVVAASVRQAGLPVEMLDLSGYTNYLDIVTEHAQRSPGRVYGITATTPQFPAAVEIAQALHAAQPGARVILGGTHATLTMAAYKHEQARDRTGRAHRAYLQLLEHFDVIVAGDGEEAVFAALRPDPPRVIDADGRKAAFGEFFLDNARLNAAPLPARDLIDLPSYHYQVDGEAATTLITQLGCPFNCGFCAGRLSPTLRHTRKRNVKNVVAEMEHLYRTYGYRGFMFYDDELNVNPEMVMLMDAIAAKQEELGVQWRLRGFVKAELMVRNPRQAEVMQKAGFRQLLVGFESGSDRILDNIQKRATLSDNTRCIEIAHDAGLTVKALMSLGHPGESENTVVETLQWLQSVRPDDFDVAVITPYPGSPYYDEVEAVRPGLWVYTTPNRYADKLYQEEVDFAKVAHYYKGIPGEYVSHVFTDHLSAEAIAHERDQLEEVVRNALHIPYSPFSPASAFEHSMGQTALPPRILRASTPPSRAASA